MLKLFILITLTTSTLFGMNRNMPPKLTWANPLVNAVQEHPTITSLQEAVLYTRQGVEQVRRHLQQEQPASCSSLEGLDLADGRTPNQHALKLTALLHAKRNDDPRGFVLQETICNPQALAGWRKTLPQEPSLHRIGWKPVYDKEFAQALLETSKLRSHLKNQFLTKQVPEKEILNKVDCAIFSPNNSYLFARKSDGTGVLLDASTHELICTYPMVHEYQPCHFSPDNKFCFIQLVDNESLYSRHYKKTTMQAFDLISREVIAIPQDCTTQTDMPVTRFSTHGRYAVLVPEAMHSQRAALYDTHSKKIIVTYLAVEGWDPVSVSPDEKYCFFNTKEGLKLFDLQAEGKELTKCTLPILRDRSHVAILWSPDSSCCLIPNELDQHRTQYHVYYPLDNYIITLDAALHNPAPCFSVDGRYCYAIHTNQIGRIYDLRERMAIKTFENVRIIDHEAPPALFSDDPTYPYCVVPLLSLDGSGHFTCSGLRVAVFNVATQELVTQPSNLEGVVWAEWPKECPYYFVHYANPIPENFRSNYFPSVEIRNKKDHSLLLRADNADHVESSPDGNYLKMCHSGEQMMLLDMATEQSLRPFSHKWQTTPDGRIFEISYNNICQAAPADCNWSNITSQQLCFIMYALLQCKQGRPLDFTDDATQPLRALFESLDEYMQQYVGRACKIKM